MSLYLSSLVLYCGALLCCIVSSVDVITDVLMSCLICNAMHCNER